MLRLHVITYAPKYFFKSHEGLCFRVLKMQVAWCYEERLIRVIDEDRQPSLTMRGTGRNSIRRRIVFKMI